jgi:hypothetical protein
VYSYPRPVLDTVYMCLLVAGFGVIAWSAGYAAYRLYRGQR